MNSSSIQKFFKRSVTVVASLMPLITTFGNPHETAFYRAPKGYALAYLKIESANPAYIKSRTW